MNKQGPGWEKTPTIHLSGKGLEPCNSIIKTETTLLENGQRTSQALYKVRHPNGWQAHEKVSVISSHQKNAN